MRKIKLFSMFLAASLGLNAQETIANLSMGPSYSHNVYFDFDTGQSESFEAGLWDIAFLRTGTYSFAERINDGLGIKVYEASNNPDDYATVNPADIASWTQLFNSDTVWEAGAFDFGSAPYGWGDYNPVTHHVEGTVVYVLKYADGSFKKFMIEDFFNGYTFKYASWNSSSSNWENEHIVTLPNSENQGKLFNYYNLREHQSVVASADLENWDLVFQTYVTDISGVMYPVIGALQNPNVKVAESTDPNVNLLSESDFKEEINSVGYDWKTFDGGGYSVNSDLYYFLKNEDGKVYRFHFLNYEGSTTGNLSFGYEDVTDQMSTVSFDQLNSFSIYPNPVITGQLNLLYEGTETGPAKVEIRDLTGKLLISNQLPGSGFYHHQIDLSRIPKGIYLVNFTIGRYSDSQKLIIK